MITIDMKFLSWGRKTVLCILVILMISFLGGCTGEMDQETRERDPNLHYEIPPFLSNTFNEDAAKQKDSFLIDTSQKEDGYFGVKAESEKRLKIQVLYEDLTYTYNLKNDGTVSFFPFQEGNGSYAIRIMEHVVDNKYSEKFRVEEDVKLKDEFQPFLHTSVYVDYTEDSECVKKANEFAKEAMDALDYISMVYKFICKNIRYDVKKAENIPTGYIPVPDETMETGKGICFDYASLAASMLRSQGIPTKLIFGYVSPDDLYHAWNMVYTEEEGWVTVEFSVSKESWNRVDLTFSANGSDSKFIGNGDNYADVYEY